MPFLMSVRSLRCFVVIVACCALSNQASAQPLDPLSFTSLGTLNLSGSDYTIDTDSLTIFENNAPGVPLFTGVMDDQGGMAQFEVVPEIAVFTFDSINLNSTANVTITGSRAIALLSQGDANFDTPLSVDGKNGVSVEAAGFLPLPGGAGGPGGYAGGGKLAGGGSGQGLPGKGPGAGQPLVPWTSPPSNARGGHAGFGGDGTAFAESNIRYAAPGLAYGDLTHLLQGGSGGASYLAVFPDSEGGGGGGAIDLAAIGKLRIGADITARGGWTQSIGTFQRAGGSGSGGGIRLSGNTVVLNAMLVATGGTTDTHYRSGGGGGRVLIQEGAPSIFSLEFDATTPDFLSRIDVSSNLGPPTSDGLNTIGPENYGLITLSPQLVLVTDGKALPFGPTIDISTSAANVEIFIRDTRFASGSTGTVDAPGYTNKFVIELASDSAVINGPGTLTNEALLRGTGQVEVPMINTALGQINTVGDSLTFTQPVVNAAGGTINSISSTLTFPGDGLPSTGGGDNTDGLTNNGTLNLISTTIHGDVHSPTGSTIIVGGGVVFEGLVSGGGNFPGAGNVTFNGGYAPGDSPAQVSLGGNLTLGGTNTLYIELGGTVAGTEYDRVEVSGFALLEGTLDVSLIDGFTPSLGDNFGFLMANSGFDVSFSGLNLPDLSAQGLGWQLNPGGSTLFLEVVAALAGDFNGDGVVDGTDFLAWQRDPSVGDLADWQANYGATAGSIAAGSAVVPEPSTLLLGAMFLSIGMTFQRFRK